LASRAASQRPACIREARWLQSSQDLQGNRVRYEAR